VAVTTEIDGHTGQKNIRDYWANHFEKQFFISPEAIQEDTLRLKSVLNNKMGEKQCVFDLREL